MLQNRKSRAWQNDIFVFPLLQRRREAGESHREVPLPGLRRAQWLHGSGGDEEGVPIGYAPRRWEGCWSPARGSPKYMYNNTSFVSKIVYVLSRKRPPYLRVRHR
ncbi:hypothetical protein BHE74_00008610 [Ensete ventricosum]|uniref:Uncharacterized protein n=1 Tax=Ensete ventricosum TaxID=4639 RepID=A0A444CA95_ENSVE|nr:hypothetical protein B296_00048043 [Ensete ventricosum]RWV82799.1 hypothetical protein GW17_00055668 [Ensete ventricosum]RWW82920.1 hypothetical protein BHE74_00008610 [Ensete ventricosum]RZR87085.1 hypothetical protein BHM03_00014393 [Ensete ventricosum]